MKRDKLIWEIKTTIIRRTVMWLSVAGLIIFGIIPLVVATILNPLKIVNHFITYCAVIVDSIISMWSGEPHTPYSVIAKRVENNE